MQVHEIRLDLLVGKLIGRASIKSGEARDRPEIRRPRAASVPARDEVVFHTFPQLRHDTPSFRTDPKAPVPGSFAQTDSVCLSENFRKSVGNRQDTYRDQRFRSTTLGVDGRASPQPTTPALPPYCLLQLQQWRDDSTGLRYTIRPLVCCERRGWLRPAAANVVTSRFV